MNPNRPVAPDSFIPYGMYSPLPGQTIQPSTYPARMLATVQNNDAARKGQNAIDQSVKNTDQ